MTGPLAFSFRTTAAGEVTILRGARAVTNLRGESARRFLADAASATLDAQQRLMARVTRNYKRGNERTAATHPRNRDGASD